MNTLEDTQLDVRSSALSNQLHQLLAKQGPGLTRSFALIDARLRPLEEAHPLNANSVSCVRIDPRQSRLSAELCPCLYPVFSDTVSGSVALAQSVREARDELQPDSLQHGSGRRICAWLQSEATASDIARHLAANLLHRHPESSAVTMLHYYDPAVLWSLWTVLTDTQRCAFLGPITVWHILDPHGNLLSLTHPAATPPTQHATLFLTAAQWKMLPCIDALNEVLREPEKLPAQFLLRSIDTQRDGILASLRCAQNLGLDRKKDLAAFARTAIRHGADFHRHPDVSQLIARLGPDDYFCAAIDELDDAAWHQIKQDLHAHV